MTANDLSFYLQMFAMGVCFSIVGYVLAIWLIFWLTTPIELDIHVEFGNGTTLEFHRGTMKACIASGRLVTIKATTHEFFQIVAAAHTVDGDPNLMLQALIATSYKGYA